MRASRVVSPYLLRPVPLALWKETGDLVEILLLNGSSTRNTAVVRDFGTEAARATTIVSRLKRNVKRSALNPKDEVWGSLIRYHSTFLRYHTIPLFYHIRHTIIFADACFLPKISGPCESYYPTWYYDPGRKQCGQFVYGGCLGNANKFKTKEECEELCVVPDDIGIV